MAITTTCIRFLIWAKKKGASFSNTLTLGHLENVTDKGIVEKIAKEESTLINAEKINWTEKFGDSFFYALGANSVESLDYSNYENADIVHDLNKPISTDFYNKYTAIIDGGTLEHIFNLPQALRNCMQCLKVNGHFIGFSPANNLMGHGFYQFSPELFYQVFSKQAGFRIIGIFIIAADFTLDTENWYEVSNPEEIKERVTLTNSLPSYLMVVAQKIRENGELENIFQSDYSELWKEKKSKDIIKKINFRNALFNKISRKIFPPIKEENLGKIDSRFFKKRKPNE